METGLTLNQDVIVMIAGSVLSMSFTYIPKFNVWFAMKSNEFKQFTMLILMFVSTAAIFGLGCANLIQINNFICDKTTAAHFVYTFVLAVMSNQSTYMVTPKPIAVKQANDIVQEDELYKSM